VAPAGTKFAALTPGSASALRRGEPVAGMGAPLGGSLGSAVGVMSSVRYVADDDTMNAVMNSRSDWCLLQVDAAMSSGNSGGPVINQAGQAVGISVLVQTPGMGGVGAANFAVAMDQAWPIIQALARDRRVARPAVGLTIAMIDRLTADRERATGGAQLMPPAAAGAYHVGLVVTSVTPGAPAAAGGFQPGDVIVGVNGKPVTRRGDLYNAIGPTFAASREVTCQVYRPAPATLTMGGPMGATREGEMLTLVVKPGSRNDYVDPSRGPRGHFIR